MKKCILAGLVVMLTLSACGASHHAATPAEKQQEAAAVASFDAAAKRCLPTKEGAPNVLVLRSQSGRQRFEACAVPQAKRTQVGSCTSRVVLGGLPTISRLKSGIGGCFLKAGL